MTTSTGQEVTACPPTAPSGGSSRRARLLRALNVARRVDRYLPAVPPPVAYGDTVTLTDAGAATYPALGLRAGDLGTVERAYGDRYRIHVNGYGPLPLDRDAFALVASYREWL